MAYRIEVRPAALKDLASLPKKVLRQLDPKILALARNPRPPGSRKLEGGENLYRIRSGDYRIVYQIQDVVTVVLVVRIGHRRDVYRGI